MGPGVAGNNAAGLMLNSSNNPMAATVGASTTNNNPLMQSVGGQNWPGAPIGDTGP